MAVRLTPEDVHGGEGDRPADLSCTYYQLFARLRSTFSGKAPGV